MSGGFTEKEYTVAAEIVTLLLLRELWAFALKGAGQGPELALELGKSMREAIMFRSLEQSIEGLDPFRINEAAAAYSDRFWGSVEREMRNL